MSDVQALQDSFQGDLTSFQGMLNYERSLRTAMGKLKHKWPAGLKVPHAMMLAHNFIPEEEAPKAPGWDPVNPNGFGPAKPNATNPMGEPGYTYTTNGEDLGVEQKGPGFYQVGVHMRWCVFASPSRAPCYARWLRIRELPPPHSLLRRQRRCAWLRRAGAVFCLLRRVRNEF